MGLNWNEIKSRALQFSKTWADACNENSQAKPFWIAFFEIFGITDICGDKIFFVDDASLFTFGVLTSTMHNAWMRQTCGRLESRYSYSNTIVYNNFPWPGFAGEALSDKHRNAIEQAAQSVLDARVQFADSSLADLYDPLTMPPALLKAHQKLDAAVDAAYLTRGGKKAYVSDAERVAFLFELYQRITSLLPVAAGKKKRNTKTTES